MHIYPRPHDTMKTCEHWISEEIALTGNFSHFAINLFSGDDTVTLSGDQIGRTLLHDYGNFLAYSCETLVDFMFEFTRFTQIHKHDFERIYTALTTLYNPLENYDKHSTITDDGETGAPETAPLVTTIDQVADDTVSTANPYIPQNKTTSHGKTENNNTRTEHTHGNIGVTKSTDMILSELDLRVRGSMIETVCRMFAEMELI